MLRKHFEMKNEDEYGFTLIELLVVILIIGILAAIAIPAFLNQRQRANDSAVKSDVRNVAMQIESELVGNPNGRVATVTNGSGTIRVGVLASGAAAGTVTAPAGVDVKLSPGVSVAVTSNATTPGVYTIHGVHSNGKAYGGTLANTTTTAAAATTARVLFFDSQNGGVMN